MSPYDRERTGTFVPTGRSLKKSANVKQAGSYHPPEATSPMRLDVGTQAQFKKKEPPAT